MFFVIEINENNSYVLYNYFVRDEIWDFIFK